MSAPDIEGGEKALDAALECWERNDMNSDRTRMRDAIAAYHAAHPAPSTGNEGGANLTPELIASIRDLAQKEVTPFQYVYPSVVAAVLRASKGVADSQEMTADEAHDYAVAIGAPELSPKAGGADYEAKAKALARELYAPHHEARWPLIAAALAQSAADERERCEAIARARAAKAKAQREKSTDEDDRMCWLWAEHEANSIMHEIAALAEPKASP